MQTPQDEPLMDFGPNLFGGEGNSTSTPSLDDADAASEALKGAAGGTDQMSESGAAEEKGEAGGGQAGVASPLTSSDAAPGGNTEQAAATQTRPVRSEVGTKALSSVKAAVKVFESINGFDEQSATQRSVVRDLMLKQSEAMELKLQGVKPPEGEDFDSIAKQLRRENNRLDALLEGKESLFGKARKAAEIAIESMQGVIAEINRLEEEA